MLFKEERTEYSIAPEQFEEGSRYTVRLVHQRGMEYFPGTVMGNSFDKIVTGTWLSETPLDKERVFLFQTQRELFDVIKS